MDKNHVFELSLAGAVSYPLTEMLRTEARDLIQAAAQAELQEFMAQYESRMLGNCRAEENWRRLRGFEWLAKVIEGVKFRDGNEVKESTQNNNRVTA